MYYFKLIFILIILIGIIYQIIYPTLFRLENKKQKEFLKLNNFDTKIYEELIEIQNKILDKKTYFIPELSFKVSKNYFNNSRYIIPIEFKLFNSIYFDKITDYIFDNALNIDKTDPDALDLKAKILDNMEMLSGDKEYINYGDLIIGFDKKENKNKIYFDTNDFKIYSFEWENENYINNKFRLYKESDFANFISFIYLIDKTHNPTYSKLLLSLFDDSNIKTILKRERFTIDNNFIDSVHVSLHKPTKIDNLFIDNFQNFIKKIFSINDLPNNYLNKNINKEIYWFSITYIEEQQYLDMNFYFRDENISDKILQYLQIPLQIYFPK
jgi:hypothetical protein